MAEIVSDEIEIAAHWPLPRFGVHRVRYGIPLMAASYLALVLTVVRYLPGIHDPRLLYGVAFPVVACILTTWGASYYDGTTIMANRDHVTLKRWWRRPAVVPISEVARIVRLTVDEPTKNGTTPRPALFFFNSKGRCVLSLFSARFDDRDLAQLWSTIGMEPEGSLDDHVKIMKLGDRFPGAFDKPAA
ncbi:MAG TPA: hypothetical protein VJT14_05925 [Candidatus Dormibacteraeota bacterium]|nr:hypothetical protein [Candidatus Dormibacteraeota bacterium]